jgi:hypothetical protein
VNPETTLAITPLRRDLHFPLPPEFLRSWHPLGAHVSLFFAALSIFFPDGERMFIHAVRLQRERLKSPELKRQVAGFVGQEAIHGREHEAYNQLLEEAGLPARALAATVATQMRQVRERLRPAAQLALTIALEHWTAIMADVLLRDSRLLAGAHPEYAAIWRWHALEETEHKAVAFDVYREVFGSGGAAYRLRILVYLLVSISFWSRVMYFHLRMVAADGRLLDLGGWWRLFKFLWTSPGVMRRTLPAWLSYFRPGFHPWQHNNRHLLIGFQQLSERYADTD